MIQLKLKQKILMSAAVMALGITNYSAHATSDSAATDEKPTAFIKEVSLIDTNSTEIGTVTLTESPTGVLFQLTSMNMPEGSHSFHIHETAACTPSEEFKTAGGHLNPDNRQHGFLAEGGPHAGDLPNIQVNAEGHVVAEAFNSRVTLTGAKGRINLMDEDGSSIMIHQNPDDYLSQPTGGGGARIACAEIK